MFKGVFQKMHRTITVFIPFNPFKKPRVVIDNALSIKEHKKEIMAKDEIAKENIEKNVTTIRGKKGFYEIKKLY